MDTNDPKSSNTAQDATAKPDAPRAEDAPETSTPEYNVQDMLRGKGLLIEDAEGREISQVYIQRGERTTIYNIYGAGPQRPVEPGATSPRTRPAPHAIGDLSLNPLPQAEIDRASALYLPMAMHDQARHRLQEHRFVLLHGPQGIGKRTAAIRLLTQFFQGDLVNNTIFELNPGLKLAELNIDDLPDGAGFFFEGGDGGALEGFDRFHLNALLTRLQDANKQNAFVLILHQAPTGKHPFPRELLQPWRLQWPEPLVASQTQVLQKHFIYATRVRDDVDPERQPDYDDLIHREQVQALLQNPLRPHQLEQLAQLLFLVLANDLELEEALARFDDRVDEEVAAWFASGHDPELETLLIAAAVFNGLPYAFIRQAGEDLLEALLPKEDEKKAEDAGKERRRKSLFARRQSVDQRLKEIHAHQEQSTRLTHFGEIQEKVVKLDDERWQPAVLRYLWQLDDIQHVLLSWLKPYGGYANHAVRTRAAAALGALALEDFGLIEAEALREWADHINANARRSAAQVLGMTLWDERHAGPSARLLHFWITQKDNWRWQWTATAAYSGLAGERIPQQALDDLKQIASYINTTPPLLGPYFQALLNLYGAAAQDPERRLAILRALDDWSAPPENRRKQEPSAFSVQRSALLGFLYLLMPDKHDPVWRLALQDIGVSEDYRVIASRLFHRSLNFRQPKKDLNKDDLHPRKMGLDLLQRLLVFVGKENDPKTYQSLKTFILFYRQTYADSPRDIQRIQHKASHWQDAQEVAPELVDLFI